MLRIKAKSFKNQGFSEVIEEEELTNELLIETINTVFENRTAYVNNMIEAGTTDAVTTILNLINETAN